MNEPFDADLRRAIKEDRALRSLEFTPAMRQNVLNRIRAEESGAIATARPGHFGPSRSRPSRFLAPASVLAAAAVLLFAITSFDFSLITRSMGSGSPKTAEVAQDSPGAMMAAPESMPAPAAPADRTVGALVDASGARSLSLPQAEALKPDDREVYGVGGDMGSAALLPAGTDRVVVLNDQSIALLKADGSESWKTPLQGIGVTSQVAVSADGSNAVSLESGIQLVSPSGEPVQLISLANPPDRIAFSSDNRLAVAVDGAVSIYQNGMVQFTVTAARQPDLAFSTDGTLAVMAHDAATLTSSLTLLDRAGNSIGQAQIPQAGRGLTFNGMGNVIVAGGAAFDRAGSPLWRAPFQAEGAQPLPGSDLVLLWAPGLLTAVQSQDGMPLWAVRWRHQPDTPTRTAVSADGRLIALAASLDSGEQALWLLSGTGAELQALRLNGLPINLAFTSERLLLLMPLSRVEALELPQ